MARKTLADWLRFQESLNPRVIDMGLERVRRVVARLPLRQPQGAVFTVAGTNGKGSTVALLEQFLLGAGRRPGVYTSPHLVRYNERVRVAGITAADPDLVAAFAEVEAARGDVPLTYFEYGTLGALLCFSRSQCDAWILEVGLGGRLDAVNAIDPDFSLITTIGLDHQEWLGDSLEAIAAEKAGIMRSGRPVFFGDRPVPAAIRTGALRTGAGLSCLGDDFGFTRDGGQWAWHSPTLELIGLTTPPHWTDAQFRNASLVLAAIAAFDPALVREPVRANRAIAGARVPGRFQIVRGEHEWVLDVAHNPQAAAVLRQQLETLPLAETTIVISLLADKAVTPFVAELAGLADRWIVCRVDDPRASSEDRMLQDMGIAGIAGVARAGSPGDGFSLAARVTSPGSRIVVCGSFRIVAPALQWLGLY